MKKSICNVANATIYIRTKVTVIKAFKVLPKFLLHYKKPNMISRLLNIHFTPSLN